MHLPGRSFSLPHWFPTWYTGLGLIRDQEKDAGCSSSQLTSSQSQVTGFPCACMSSFRSHACGSPRTCLCQSANKVTCTPDQAALTTLACQSCEIACYLWGARRYSIFAQAFVAIASLLEDIQSFSFGRAELWFMKLSAVHVPFRKLSKCRSRNAT